MVDANEILARTLRCRVGLELQEGKIDDAIGQEHAFGKRAVELRYLLEPERLLIELRGLPRVLNAQCDMADTAFRLLCHGEPPIGCSRAAAGLVSVFGNGCGTGLHQYPRGIAEPAIVSSLRPAGRVEISRGAWHTVEARAQVLPLRRPCGYVPRARAALRGEDAHKLSL